MNQGPYQDGGGTPRFGARPQIQAPGQGPYVGGPIEVPVLLQGYPSMPPTALRDSGMTMVKVIGVSAITSTLVCSVFFAAWFVLGGRQRTPSVVIPGRAEVTAPGGHSLGKVLVVPRLLGLSVGQARKQSEERRLRLVLEAEEPSEGAPPGTVLHQSPLAGSSLVEGGEVRVVVASKAEPPAKQAGASSGKPAEDAAPAKPAAPEGSALPRVTRLSLHRAKALLKRKGYRVNVLYQDYDEDISPLRVVRQTPPAGTLLPRGGSVTIVANPSG